MEPKRMTMAEIRESLAKDDAESINDYRDRFDLFLNGCPGYNNYDNEDCIDFYINKHYPDMFADDEKPIIVLQILDDGNGSLIANIVQYQSDVTFEWA